MTKILNHINTYADLTAYNNDKKKNFPNISYIQDSDEVKWVKDDSVHNVCKYNVTSTESATKLLNSNTGITYQIIDGIKQDAVQTSYTFDTMGEHIVEYKLDGTSIGFSAFQNCKGLTSITIPDSVTSIGNQAFYGCTGLTNITIPNSVTSIGSSAFLSCEGLTSITIPDSVTSIGNQAFYGCTSLTSITIPNSVTSIGRAAFQRCSGLTSVTIGNSVTSIDYGAFDSCPGLTSIVVNSANTVYDSRDNCNAIINTSTNELIAGCKNTVIPDSVTSIGEGAFYGCSGLTSITIPSAVTSIGRSAFQRCDSLPIENNIQYADTYVVKAVDKSLTTYTIKEGTKWIGEYAFSSCTGLTSITIPDSVTNIGNEAFSSCEGLTSVTIGSGVTSIGEWAFSGCTALTSITIPNNVTSIGDSAFSGCTGLTSITVEATTPPTLGFSAFDGTNNCPIYLPAESLEAYMAVEDWIYYADRIQPISE